MLPRNRITLPALFLSKYILRFFCFNLLKIVFSAVFPWKVVTFSHWFLQKIFSFFAKCLLLKMHIPQNIFWDFLFQIASDFFWCTWRFCDISTSSLWFLQKIFFFRKIHSLSKFRFSCYKLPKIVFYALEMYFMFRFYSKKDHQTPSFFYRIPQISLWDMEGQQLVLSSQTVTFSCLF